MFSFRSNVFSASNTQSIGRAELGDSTKKEVSPELYVTKESIFSFTELPIDMNFKFAFAMKNVLEAIEATPTEVLSANDVDNSAHLGSAPMSAGGIDHLFLEVPPIAHPENEGSMGNGTVNSGAPLLESTEMNALVSTERQVVPLQAGTSSAVTTSNMQSAVDEDNSLSEDLKKLLKGSLANVTITLDADGKLDISRFRKDLAREIFQNMGTFYGPKQETVRTILVMLMKIPEKF